MINVEIDFKDKKINIYHSIELADGGLFYPC